MNFSSLLGIACALAVFLISVFTATPSREIFLDPHAILIVIGGTLAASLICFPMKTLATLFKVFFQKILGQYSSRNEVVLREIVDLAKGHRADPNYLTNQAANIKTPFLREAIELMNKGGMTPQALDSILRKRALTHYKRYEKEANIFKTIGKFPPAFGLMGTTLGMISLLQSLGSPDSFKKLGPAMAIGLVATLYGIALTNLVLVPIGENLTKLNEEDEILREMVMDGIKVIRAQEHHLVVEEHLKSYLLPSERLRLEKAA